VRGEGVRREQVNGGMGRVRIVPFKCADCGGGFAETEGGVGK